MELNAEFSVEPTTTGADVILQSRGGVDASGKKRNTDYNAALILLLARMAGLDLAIQQAYIASSKTDGLALKKRRLELRGHSYPVQLGSLTDFEQLRLDLGFALGAFKSGPDSKGKGTSAKRVRLSVVGPGLDQLPGDAFQNILAGAADDAPQGATDKPLKYAPIGDFLRAQSMSEVRLSLDEVAQLVGPLAPSAATHQFWANARDHQLSRRKHWFDAGFDAFFEPASQSVRFVRSEGRRFEGAPPPVWTEPPTTDPDELARSVRALREKLKGRSGPLPPPPGSTDVQKVMGQTTRYNRDPNVIAWVIEQADGVCEVCEKPAPFARADGTAYLEVHHLRPLVEGGPDTTDNAVAACPNCHRALHYSAKSTALRAAVIVRLERMVDHPCKLNAAMQPIPTQ
ncbi:HNH endonuclease signature motif containing protein [Brevundimonas sp.]|uniref:HNH endonuclease n=1 Tax=Brevundimonas sp. TaxID=1871086 RepID=UPI0025C3B367|nr:HNH endonuclease signature motif containing protein [Brevundimonas sp.]